MVDEENDLDCADERRRPQFDLRLLVQLTALTAVCLALFPVASAGSRVILAVMAATWLFGCRATRRAVAGLLLPLYLPYVWLIVDVQDYPWNSYRWHWIGMLGQLPGLMAEIPLHPLSEVWFQTLTTAATLAIFFGAVLIARLSHRALLVTLLVVSIFSLLNSTLCWAFYRM